MNLTQVFAGVVDQRLLLLLIVERLILQLGTLQSDLLLTVTPQTGIVVK